MRKFVNVIVSVVILVMFLLIFEKGFSYFQNVNETQSKELLEQAARKATVECYAIEGAYPSEFAYLEENYGVSYDINKYSVEYIYSAANIMPKIVIYEKNR